MVYGGGRTDGKLSFFHAPCAELFDDSSYQYYWVISLSRAVELTTNGSSRLGVLLVDMNYSSIEQLLEKANKGTASEYLYLMDGDGETSIIPSRR